MEILIFLSAISLVQVVCWFFVLLFEPDSFDNKKDAVVWLLVCFIPFVALIRLIVKKFNDL